MKTAVGLCLLLVAGLMGSGCVRDGFQRTAATMTRIVPTDGGHEVLRCEVMLGWKLPKLLQACGRPVRSLDADQRCLLYDNLAHSFGSDNKGAPWFAVCLVDPKDEKGEKLKGMRAAGRKLSKKVKRKRLRRLKVQAVYGLSAVPDTVSK